MRTLYPFINLLSSNPSVHLTTQAAKAFLPSSKSASVFLRAGADIVARNFSRPLIKPKITNWRIPSIIGGFNFVDGTDFDFVDGTPFDFVS